MKMAAIILLLLVPMAAGGQDHPGMSEKDMQKMKQEMEKMQSCMENIDQAKLKVFEERSNQLEAEVKSLCANGKRDEAQEKTIAFGQEMMKDPTIKAMRKCGEGMKGMMPKMPFANQGQDEDEDRSRRHVCD